MPLHCELFSPDENRDPGSPALRPFQPRQARDSDSDYGTSEYTIKSPKEARKAEVASLLSSIDPARNPDDTDQVPSCDDASDNGLDGDGSEFWVKGSNPSSPGGSNAMRAPQEPAAMNLQELATKAVTHVLARSDPQPHIIDTRQEPSHQEYPPASTVRESMTPDLSLHRDGHISAAVPLKNITLPPRDLYPTADHFSPRPPNVSPLAGGPPGPLTSPRTIDARSPTNSLPLSDSELPPLNSPSNDVGWLPSVKELMISGPSPGSPGRDGDHPPPSHSSSLPHILSGSGPAVPPLRPASFSGTHIPSPMSPGGIHTRELQSPLRPPALCSPFYVTPSASSDTTTPLPRLVGDYGRNSTESPNDQSGPSAADSSGGANDGAGTEIGTFKCSFEGCQARPFQTQYLLNSHANVHSAERPHYCSVMGCPRSKAGKGFKRKNEMIRHGFVHKSPGYACPFCPDREHKYPRPDNLQRHVRSRHVEVDKNDSRLLEVLAQRPDGPSRGRRRRTLPA